MKNVIASIVAVAGLSVAASAATTVNMLVSTDGVNFSNTLNLQANTGLRTVEILTTVSNTGTATIGLGSFQYQPTVSNWGSGGAADALVPFTTTFGGNTTTPSGVVADAAGQYGRISPWGGTSSTSSQRLFGHVNTDAGTTYLRIAQAQVTSWIGGTGNSTGGSGVNIKQLNDIGRSASDPAFNTNLTNIHVLRFAIQVDTSIAPRTLTVDAPLAGFGNRNSTTGGREIYWYATSTEATGSIREVPTINSAAINVVVPTPASLALMGLGGLAVARRRRA